ncbi:MAG: hypothetical protein LBC02_01965 [Planctomycetaceae bacterium]|jgi:hypothetical protein|nr:hypothetical protein [Planctomycetaceae bacterium]
MKKNQIKVLVNVLGVTIEAKFKQRSDRFFSSIPIGQAQLCYMRAVRLLFRGSWSSDISVLVNSEPSGDSRVIRLFYTGRVVCALEVRIYEDKAELVMSNIDFLKVVDGSLLTKQNEFLLFSFVELDRKFLSAAENREVIERLTSEGLLVKQGELLMFGTKREKQEAVNETTI